MYQDKQAPPLLDRERILIWIALAGVILRILLLSYGTLTFGQQEFLSIYGDTPGYLESASNLVAGRGYSVDYFGILYPETSRPPGYPALIGASLFLFRNTLPLVTLQIILSGIIPILGYLVISHIFRKRIAALTSAAFLAFEPLVVILSTVLLTETIFMATFLGALALFFSGLSPERKNRAIILGASGILFAYAALVRPVGLYMLPIAALYGFYHLWKEAALTPKEIAVSLVIFITASVLPVSAWMSRNKLVADSFALTSLTGVVSYFRLGVSVIAVERGAEYGPVRQELRAKAKRDIGGELRDARNASYYQRQTLAIIKEHPSAFAKLMALGAFHLFTHDGYFDAAKRIVPNLEAPQSAAQITLLARGEFSRFVEVAKRFLAWPWIIFVAARILWILVFFSALYGSAVLWIKKILPKSSLVFTFVLIASLTLPALTLGLGIEGRIRLPANIFILTLAFYGWSHLMSLFRSRLHSLPPRISRALT